MAPAGARDKERHDVPERRFWEAKKALMDRDLVLQHEDTEAFYVQ